MGVSETDDVGIGTTADPKFYTYYIYRILVYMATIAADYAVSYGLTDRTVAGDASQWMVAPLWEVGVSLVAAAVLFLIYDIVVAGGIAGKLAYGDARKGMLPFWTVLRRLIRHD